MGTAVLTPSSVPSSCVWRGRLGGPGFCPVSPGARGEAHTAWAGVGHGGSSSREAGGPEALAPAGFHKALSPLAGAGVVGSCAPAQQQALPQRALPLGWGLVSSCRPQPGLSFPLLLVTGRPSQRPACPHTARRTSVGGSGAMSAGSPHVPQAEGHGLDPPCSSHGRPPPLGILTQASSSQSRSRPGDVAVSTQESGRTLMTSKEKGQDAIALRQQLQVRTVWLDLACCHTPPLWEAEPGPGGVREGSPWPTPLDQWSQSGR